MVKYVDTTNNYFLKLIKEQRYKNVFMYTVWVSLAKFEQVFICCNQLNSFNGMDLSWVLRIGRKSFIQSDSDIFRFHLLFLKFLQMILKFSWVTWSWCFSMLSLSICDLILRRIYEKKKIVTDIPRCEMR